MRRLGLMRRSLKGLELFAKSKNILESTNFGLQIP